MSSPADVPHFRPAGSSPQLRVTFGAGFGSPSPVMGFPTFAAGCADNVARESRLPYAVSRKTAQANVENRIRGVGMTPPREALPLCGPLADDGDFHVVRRVNARILCERAQDVHARLVERHSGHRFSVD